MEGLTCSADRLLPLDNAGRSSIDDSRTRHSSTPAKG